MEHKATLSLAKRITPHLLMCTGGILGFILLAIYPSQKSLADLDGEIKKLEAQIGLQETLTPVYKEFLKKGKYLETQNLISIANTFRLMEENLLLENELEK